MLGADYSDLNAVAHDPVPIQDRGLWSRAGLVAVILVAAAFRLWNLDQNGYGNPYYAAAVRSMLANFSNFFFGSFDPIGFITVDKPPVAIWIQAASAKVLGYRGISLLLPEALMGIASVVLVYHLVRRIFGTSAGLLAGLVLAITPICVAVDRDNLPDSALVFTLLMSAWALSLATETGRIKPLLLSAILVGIGFNIKMLAAFVVLPTFYLCYLLAAPCSWRSKLVRLTAVTLLLLAVSLSWSVVVELTPKSQRPYIGGSRKNSAIELALGYNGLGRVLGGRGNFGPGSPPRFPGGPLPRSNDVSPAAKQTTSEEDRPKESAGESTAMPDGEPDDHLGDKEKGLASTGPGPGFPPGSLAGGLPPGGPDGPGGPFRGGMPPMFGGNPGLLRFTSPLMSAQITWLFPLAILGAVVAAVRAGRQWPIGKEHLSLLLWGGWLGTHWLVFSFARGIFHEYYTTIMGPAVAALAGIGTLALYEEWRQGRGRGYLPTALILTAAWQAYIISQSPEIRRWLLPGLGVGTLASVLGLLSNRWLTARRESLPWVKLATIVGLGSLLIGPACWSLAPVMSRGNGVMPIAEPSALTGRRDINSGMPPMPPLGMEDERNDKLIEFLRANRQRERIFVAAPGSIEVSSIIINTGETAVSLGGFMGGDPVLTKEDFARMVQEGEVRFVLLGGGPGGGMPFPPGAPPFPPGGPPFPLGGPAANGGPFGPGGPGNSEVAEWVRENGKIVDTKLWQAEEPPGDAEAEEEAGGPVTQPGGPMGNFFRRMRRMARLYDCRPELGLVTLSSGEK